MDAAELDALAELLVRAPEPTDRDEAARRLGIGHAELAARLSALADLGAPLHEDARGLRLDCPDLLDAAVIGAGLSDLPVPAEVEVRRVCESTNALAGAGPMPRLCLAEVQTAGRGRRGNAWKQPFGGGLALSYGASLPPRRLDGLAIAMAVATAQGLAGCGFGAALGLKWPNDLYASGAKLGGVMVEAAGGRQPRVVVGLGLNVHAAPVLGGRPAAALSGLGPVPVRNELAIAVVRALAAALCRFEREGFAPFAADFARLDVLAGRPVDLAAGARTISGVARGVGPLGELVVETPGGVRCCTAGEVSLGHV